MWEAKITSICTLIYDKSRQKRIFTFETFQNRYENIKYYEENANKLPLPVAQDDVDDRKSDLQNIQIIQKLSGGVGNFELKYTELLTRFSISVFEKINDTTDHECSLVVDALKEVQEKKLDLTKESHKE